MRMIIFFDLPTITMADRRNYTKFRKFLIEEGFIMQQFSVYTKLALNNSIIQSTKLKIDKHKPENGLVQMLTITEKQFAGIETIVGEYKTNTLQSTNRLTIF